MARADRLERLDAQREEAEEEYRDALIAALRETAGGRWGLFDHQNDRAARARTAPVIAELEDMAADIDQCGKRWGWSLSICTANFWRRAVLYHPMLRVNPNRRAPGWSGWAPLPDLRPALGVDRSIASGLWRAILLFKAKVRIL